MCHNRPVVVRLVVVECHLEHLQPPISVEIEYLDDGFQVLRIPWPSVSVTPS